MTPDGVPPMRTAWLAAVVLTLVFAGAAVAQPPDEPAAESAPSDDLAGRQEQVAQRFHELERLLLRMAELTAPTDPRRAALLRQAVAQSKDRAIDQQFDKLVELLRQQRMSAVINGQGEVHDDLVKLLELLLSEDRSKRIESEKERIREYLKRVNKIIKEQRGIQGATQRDGEPQELADRQGELSDKTGKLAEDLAENEGSRPIGKDDESSESEGKQGKDAEEKPGEKSEKSDDSKQDDQPGSEKDGQQQDGEKSDGEKSDVPKQEGEQQDAEGSEKKPGEPGGEKSEPGQPMPGEAPPVEPPPAGDSQQGDAQQSEQNPAQQRLEKAQQRMQEAQKKLEEAQREDAEEKQAEALRELEQAKAELEEILRQLREEEMARTLAMLEARFRQMLDAQVEVYEGTQRLDHVPQSDRDRDDEIEAGRLSRKEAEIAIEAEKALAVLQEEGSAVAFPEAVIEIRDDMYTVRDRLGEAQIGELTQGIEEDIITALEEMITALEKAQKDMQEQNQQPPGQAGGEMEMPLVDTLSELKMIRALQMRVNKRTQRYSEMTENEQADRPELLEALRRLAEREERIHKVTRDIVVGRNR